MKRIYRSLAVLLCISLGVSLFFPAVAQEDSVVCKQINGKDCILGSVGDSAASWTSLWGDQAYRVFDSNSDEKQPEDPLGTGAFIQVLNETGIAEKTYYAVIRGDVTGDGRITTFDARQILRCSISLSQLVAVQLEAADQDLDGEVSTFDARQVLRQAIELPVQTREEYESSVRQSEEESRSIAASIEASLEQSRLDAMRFDPVLKEGPAVDMSYFNDTVFVGDSVSMMLSYHDNRYNSFGNARFLVRGSMSARNALWPVSSSSYHPKLNGQRVRVEDGVKMLGAKKVYIMLGMNEISMGVNAAVQNMTKLCDLIVQKSPGVTIIVESVTPMAQGSTSTTSRLNNSTISQFNQKMQGVCEERRWYFLNVAEALSDANGYLKRSYCSDYPTMGLHLTYDAAGAWLQYIKTHPVPNA